MESSLIGNFILVLVFCIGVEDWEGEEQTKLKIGQEVKAKEIKHLLILIELSSDYL